jgi:hypothetical protein
MTCLAKVTHNEYGNEVTRFIYCCGTRTRALKGKYELQVLWEQSVGESIWANAGSLACLLVENVGDARPYKCCKDIILQCVLRIWLPLWSSGQSSWLQIHRSGFDSWHYQIFWEVVGLERDPLCLVSTVDELLERESCGSGLENREYDCRDQWSWPRGTPLSAKVGTNFADKRQSLGRYIARGLKPRSLVLVTVRTKVVHDSVQWCWVSVATVRTTFNRVPHKSIIIYKGRAKILPTLALRSFKIYCAFEPTIKYQFSCYLRVLVSVTGSDSANVEVRYSTKGTVFPL